MINSYNEFKELICSFKAKPKLLLHVCCAPCSSHVLELLNKYFDITIYFSNDNIYPKEEFSTRLNELNKFINEFENVNLISDEYNDQLFYEAIKGYENLGERSIRCYYCYKLRLEKTARYAKENNYDYFTTVLSISPHKLEKWINEIGYDLENKYNVKFLYSNFKKENGYKNSIELSKKYNLYRQDYCGCMYSFNERRSQNGANKENEN